MNFDSSLNVKQNAVIFDMQCAHFYQKGFAMFDQKLKTSLFLKVDISIRIIRDKMF